MSVFIIRRLLQAALIVFIMSLIVFFGVNVIGDPVYMLVSPDADQADIEKAIERLGLNLPIYEQYFKFLNGAWKGDLGDSFIFGEPALKLILHHMPATLELAFTALAMAIVIGIPLGLFAGLYPEQKISKGIMAGSILGFSLPTFWVGLMLIMLFAVVLGWLPSTGRGDTAKLFGLQTSLFTLDGLSHVILPALNLALLKISLAIRLPRSGVREAMGQDYVKFASAKGL
ncbi:MAG: ABC transporter permease, partial [Alphaproteobacteria bacterium]